MWSGKLLVLCARKTIGMNLMECCLAICEQELLLIYWIWSAFQHKPTPNYTL